MRKCSMWKLELNKKLPTTLPPMERYRKKHNIQGDIRTLLGKDCEVEKMMRLLREKGMLEEIKRRQDTDEISKSPAASYSH